jgi:hypothetical protein
VGVPVTSADVRAFIACRLLGVTHSSREKRLGSITLHSHQASAVDRLQSAINEFGGALLCDQVGMGKTFVALALCDGEACVVAPAVLKDMWLTAAASAGQRIEFISTESLSRTNIIDLPRGFSLSTKLITSEIAGQSGMPRSQN